MKELIFHLVFLILYSAVKTITTYITMEAEFLGNIFHLAKVMTMLINIVKENSITIMKPKKIVNIIWIIYYLI
ncbi:Uncharacterised protein [Chlamydia abortus]|nr:Uncharacterised protein [Chlamydia abortus]